MAADRHLLFGLLALQNGLIDQVQLVAAFQAWTRDRSRPLADHLVARGDLDAEDRDAVDTLVARHLKKHGGDAERSLAAVPAGRSTRASLAALGDPELDATLGHVGSGSTEPGDADRTTTYAVGSATSEGQRFRVLRPHARGGLGAVFVALDQELHREVALKQIQGHHADDVTSRSRFLLEAEITGGLEHPGIVPVYGLGADASGRPFYAMRFIRGDSLKEAIERFHQVGVPERDRGARGLELRKLLRRFLDVCDAIEYAHGRGVIHRDLKPGNIIVGRHGETLVVDWGLAKARGKAEVGTPLEERPLVPSSASGSAETLPGSALGTPAYMSPEQARGDLESLGPASDVYSLGATLYCLLTGRPPFEDPDLGALLRKVQAGDFPAPRVRDRTIDPALEAVCLKAMATAPADRYATPRALAEDLERWIADEPVSARREPWTARARRWIGRHRTAVVGAGSALVVALAGLVGFLVVQARANRALQAALDREVRAKDRADARFNMAREAVEAFYSGASDDVMLRQPQLRDLRTKLLQSALQFYRRWQSELQADSQLSPNELFMLALACERVGEIQTQVGAKDEAIRAFEQALVLFETPALRHHAQNRGKVLVKIARVQRQMGRPADALRTFRRALDVLTPIATNPVMQGDVAWALLNLGSLQDELGRPEEARRTLEQSRDAGEKLARAIPFTPFVRHDLAAALMALANVHSELGRRDEAIRGHEQARAVLARLVAEHPANSGNQADRGRSYEYQADLARSYNNLGYEFTEVDRPAEALAMLEKGRQIREALFTAQPVDSGFRSDLARSYYYLARFRVRNGPAPEALRALRRAEELFDGLAVVVPEDLFYRACLQALHIPLIGPGAGPPSAEDQAGRRRQADRAMEALRRAVAGGFKKVDLLRRERDLDPLRSREDFRALLRALEVELGPAPADRGPAPARAAGSSRLTGPDGTTGPGP